MGNFQSPSLRRLNFFHHHTISDEMLLVVASGDCIFFNCLTFVNLICLISGGLISTIDLATKFGLPGNKMYTLHINTHFLLWGVWALFCLTPMIAIYLGREGWSLYGCLNFRSSHCICNWCWISIVALKVKSDFIIECINYIDQAYYFCVQCFINGGEVGRVEHMVFDARGQAKEGGM